MQENKDPQKLYQSTQIPVGKKVSSEILQTMQKLPLIRIQGKQSHFLLYSKVLYLLFTPSKINAKCQKRKQMEPCFKKQKSRISIMAINFDNTLHQRGMPLKLDNAKKIHN